MVAIGHIWLPVTWSTGDDWRPNTLKSVYLFSWCLWKWQHFGPFSGCFPLLRLKHSAKATWERRVYLAYMSWSRSIMKPSTTCLDYPQWVEDLLCQSLVKNVLSETCPQAYLILWLTFPLPSLCQVDKEKKKKPAQTYWVKWDLTLVLMSQFNFIL